MGVFEVGLASEAQTELGDVCDFGLNYFFESVVGVGFAVFGEVDSADAAFAQHLSYFEIFDFGVGYLSCCCEFLLGEGFIFGEGEFVHFIFGLVKFDVLVILFSIMKKFFQFAETELVLKQEGHA